MRKSKSKVKTQRNPIVQPMVRTMLYTMGVPFADQPAGAADKYKLLEALADQDPERYENLYKVIVDGVDPLTIGMDDDDSTLIAGRELSKFIREEYNKLGGELTARIDSITKDAIYNLKDDARSVIESLRLVKDNFIDNVKLETQEAIKREAMKFRKIEVKVGNKKAKKLDVVLPKEFDRILALAANRLNILLTGPAGCGKTFIAGKVAESLDLDFASQSCSEGMSESALTGWLLPVGDSGKFCYVQSEFVRLYENGGVFLFDEMDAADPNVLVFMNQALANGGFYLPQRFEKPYIKKHPDFVAIAATNTFGNGGDAMYVGRNQLDAATLDRFKIGTVPMTYDDTVEEALIGESILDWGRSVRHQINSHKLRRIMSTRVLLDSTKMALSGWRLEDIKDAYYSDWSEAELSMIGGRI